MPRVSGKFANQTGQHMERFIEERIVEAGYQYVEPALFPAMQIMNQPIYTKQRVAGKDLYGKDHKVDFELYHERKWVQCLVIESKWQQAGGSVEEKYPFLVQSIRRIGIPTIIVLDGGGYSPGAKQWLKAQAGSGAVIQVLEMREFQKFVNDGRL